MDKDKIVLRLKEFEQNISKEKISRQELGF